MDNPALGVAYFLHIQVELLDGSPLGFACFLILVVMLEEISPFSLYTKLLNDDNNIMCNHNHIMN